MEITLYYLDFNYHYTVDIFKDVLIDYLYEKETGIPYQNNKMKEGEIHRWCEIERKWLHNELDEYSIINSQEFIDYATNYYEDEAYTKFINEHEGQEEDY